MQQNWKHCSCKINNFITIYFFLKLKFTSKKKKYFYKH
jgi:hypothetical protein